MDAVLGLSVTPSAVGLVLVEGPDADGATVDRDAIYPGRRSTPRQTSDEAAAAVLRSEALAVERGHRIRSIGVTWSDDANLEATLLLRSLSQCGFDNVVPVRLPEASEALAWGVADVIGNDVTAVCVVESHTVIALVVHTGEGAVQTAVNHSIADEEALVRWLHTVFAKADWRPEALVLVGSGSGLDALMPRLEDVLAVPVFAPAEAELALARGAALAAAHTGEVTLSPRDERAADRRPKAGARAATVTAPLALLAAGTVTFVVSVSAALSMQLGPGRDMAPSPAAKSSPDVPVAAPRPVASPAPVALPVAPPAEVAPPLVEPPAELPAEPPVAIETAPPPDSAVLAPEVPVGGIPGAPVLPPESMAPGLVPAQPTPVPERRGFLQRIRDRFSNAGDNAPAAPAPVDPALAPPPVDPALAPPPDPALAAPPAPVPPPPEAVLPPPPPPEAPPLLPPP
ncbi:hypothetical protein SAMN04489835_4015 [Mycolicibacterium rutilum]|uniref:DUF7159 domain-containing protein n=1 Tax=Mycolicibacterium rutilum TaxID=370526 RepID=A0A1H6L0Y2_MYCRU|nr:hypothetical protein [Mycolicibacterium rutilum]SEH77767.1 hypothetical protein SAMN04489835_4015 [Mycolicibacterium rutilum]